jgi:small subunit ribosomal protein S15
MALDSLRVSEIVKTYQTHAADTGSCEVQVAILTNRINGLIDHFKLHAKDSHSKRGLLHMVNKRRGLLDYLKQMDVARYKDLIGRLELRK